MFGKDPKPGDSAEPTIEEALQKINIDSFIDSELLEKNYSFYNRNIIGARYNPEDDGDRLAPHLARVIGSNEMLSLMAEYYELSQDELIDHKIAELKDLLLASGTEEYDSTEIFSVADEISKAKATFGPNIIDTLDMGNFKIKLISALKEAALRHDLMDEALFASADILGSAEIEALLADTPELRQGMEEDMQRELKIQKDLELGIWNGDPELRLDNNGHNILHCAGRYGKIFGRKDILGKLEPQAIRAIEKYLAQTSQWSKENPEANDSELLEDAYLLKVLQGK